MDSMAKENQELEEKDHKRAINAWVMYDWANSSFVTSVVAAILPVYYASVAAREISPNLRTAYWGYTTTIAFLIVALLGPILGAMADFSGAKKRYLTIFVILGVTGTALLYLIQTGTWMMASLIFIVASIGFSGSLVFYDSLLPHVARQDEIDQVSSKGYALGYLGGGILLAINLAMILFLPGLLSKTPPIPQDRVQQGKILLTQDELESIARLKISDLEEISSIPLNTWNLITSYDPEALSTGQGLTQTEWIEITGETAQKWQELSKKNDGVWAPITSLSAARWSTINEISRRDLAKITLSLTSGDWQQVMKLLDASRLTGLMSRIAFLTVALWWLVFTIPLWRHVTEPKRRVAASELHFNPVQASFKRLKHTFGEIRKYKELVKFLVAFWLYYNGIGTIITMASIYASELHFSQTIIIGTLLLIQFVGIPFSFLFGYIPKKIGTKPAIQLSLMVFILIAIGAYFLKTEIHFVLIGFAVAMVLGGSQALSRSLFGRMVPKSKSAEFFSFFSISEKVAGTIGPLVFGLVSQIMGGSRLSVLSLIVFFIIGSVLLTRVKAKEGIEVAEAEEKALA
jgi:MFS-type transporter involved in bile tolerance (Atg22 family)